MTPRLHAQASHNYLEDPSAEDFARAARWALQSEDLALAIQQVSAALTFGPEDRNNLALLDAILARSKQSERLVELPADGAFWGLCAVHARWLARRGDLDGALAALFEVVAFEPSAHFLSWGVTWTASTKARRGILPMTIARGLVKLTESVRAKCESPSSLEHAKLERFSSNVESGLLIAERTQFKHPTHDDLRVARSRALRLLGLWAEAERCIEAGSKKNWGVLVERAAIAAARGDASARSNWLRRAAESRPDSPETHCDLARALLDEGRLSDAVHSFEKALSLEGCPRDGVLLAAYAGALRDHKTLLPNDFPVGASPSRIQALCRDLHAYVTRLPDPIDPLIAVVRSATSRAASTHGSAPMRVRVTSERPACASLELAFQHSVSRVGKSAQLETICTARDNPASDLLSAQAVDQTHFQRHDSDATLQGIVSALARSPFGWQTWCDSASALGARTESSIWLQLSGTPADDETLEAVQWVHAYQVAGALLAAHAGNHVELRFSDLRRTALQSKDWMSAAAVLGLRALGERYPALSHQVVALLKELVPSPEVSLGPAALAVAVSGDALAEDAERPLFVSLRQRVQRELAELAD